MITAGNRGYGAWRDGGFTDPRSRDPANPKLISHINWSPPFPGGTHTPLPLPGRNLAVVADEANAEKCAKGMFHTFVVDVREPENPVPISTLPTPKDRDYCGPGVVRSAQPARKPAGQFPSEETIFATYNVAGVRVFDIRDAFAPKELAFWVPPPPKKLSIRARTSALAAKSADVYVTNRRTRLRHRLERRSQRAGVPGVGADDGLSKLKAAAELNLKGPDYFESVTKADSTGAENGHRVTAFYGPQFDSQPIFHSFGSPPAA